MENNKKTFATIKEMVSPPLLGYADYSLHTDKSSRGLGSVLLQKQYGEERVVRSGRNFPAHKIEFLALKWSVTDKFHDYLYGTLS